MRAENATRHPLVSESVSYIPLDLPVITKAELQGEPAKPPGPKEVLPCGVRWRKDVRKYTATPRYKGKLYDLGCFYTAQEAENVLKEFRKLHPLPSSLRMLAKPPNPKEILPCGVRWNKYARKYTAAVTHKGKHYFLGSFYIMQEAAEAFKKFRKLHPLVSYSMRFAGQKPRLGGQSKYKGVWFNVVRQRWEVSLQVQGKQKFLGQFPNTKEGEKQAALAYDKAAEELWGEHAKHNQYWFPDDFKL